MTGSSSIDARLADISDRANNIRLRCEELKSEPGLAEIAKAIQDDAGKIVEDAFVVMANSRNGS